MPSSRALLVILVSLASLLPVVAGAVPAGTIEKLQTPAWVERNGVKRPAWAGMRLHSGDQLFTGADARVQLRLDEGSLVKLGENAEFHLRTFARPAGKTTRFSGFLDVLKGAFRFTTTAISRRHQRDLSVRIAAVTAGIRGTDVWGKAAEDRDIVCLIEGRIEVRRGSDAPFTMSDPLTFYIAPKDAPALPVAPVDPEQLRLWARETETQTFGAVLSAGGRWAVQLSSHITQAFALSEMRALQEAGIPGDVETATVGDRTWYRLVIKGFENRDEASVFAEQAGERLGARGARVFHL